MYEGIGKAFDALFRLMSVVIIISVPLAIWKVIDIIVWICKHITIGVIK